MKVQKTMIILIFFFFALPLAIPGQIWIFQFFSIVSSFLLVGRLIEMLVKVLLAFCLTQTEFAIQKLYCKLRQLTV